MRDVCIRPMEKGEERAVVQVGRRAFRGMESLFIGTPREAMVAEFEGRIIGAILYKWIDARREVVYLDVGFVDPRYHGRGVGRKLYTETFSRLMQRGCRALTALVKDDNVGSWKLLMDNGFQRTTLAAAAGALGFPAMLRQYFATPMCLAVGMDFYLLCPKTDLPAKRERAAAWWSFLLGNLLLSLPLWIRVLLQNPASLPPDLAAYCTILAIFALTRYFGGLWSGRSRRFRLNNGGGFLTMLLSLFGTPFPMNGNWYPVQFENTQAMKRKMALPELVKWGILLLLSLLGGMGGEYFETLARLGCVFSVLSVIPLYPFDAYGAGRIYRYKKGLWLITAVLSILSPSL